MKATGAPEGGTALANRSALMSLSRRFAPRAVLLAALLASGCSGSITPPGGGPTTSEPDNLEGALIAGNARRLSNHEYDNSIADLLGIEGRPSAGFAADTRQSGFTVNVAQRVDSTLGDQLAAAATTLAHEAVSKHLSTVLTCSPSAADCKESFIASFASRAFRRPASAEERAGLAKVFEAGATGGSFNDGVEAVITAVLQSASFLYLEEGGSGDGAVRELGPYEQASALAYFITAAPPDATLLAAAANNQLATADQREAQMRRLLAEDRRAKAQVVRFFKEWLGLDGIFFVDRQSSQPFSSLRPSMDGEASAFIEEVLFRGDGSLATLLGADYSMVDSTMSSLYGLQSLPGDTYTRASFAETPRRGILSQAAFLAAYAAADASSPVKRGVVIMRRLLCRDIQFPTGAIAAKAMMMPQKDPAKTTRQRFSQHSSDPACRGCHSQIDPLGFAFEAFDQVGKLRTQENGVDVDSSGTLVGTDVDGSFGNAAEMVARLAGSAQVRGCFARNVLRFAAAQSSTTMEEAFLSLWQKLPAEKQGNLIEVLVAFARSDLFKKRAMPH